VTGLYTVGLNQKPAVGRIVLIHEHGNLVRPAIVSGVREDGWHIDCHVFGGAVIRSESWVELLRGVPFHDEHPGANCFLWWNWP